MTSRSRTLDLNDAVREFEELHKKPGSGIVSVRKHGNSIMVVVDSENDARRLPRSHEGINVAPFINLGSGQVKLFLR